MRASLTVSGMPIMPIAFPGTSFATERGFGRESLGRWGG